MNIDKTRIFKSYQILDLEEADGLYPAVKIEAKQVRYFAKKGASYDDKVRVRLTLDSQNLATIGTLEEKLKDFLPPGKRFTSLLEEDGCQMYGDMRRINREQNSTKPNPTKALQPFSLKLGISILA